MADIYLNPTHFLPYSIQYLQGCVNCSFEALIRALFYFWKPTQGVGLTGSVPLLFSVVLRMLDTYNTLPEQSRKTKV